MTNAEVFVELLKPVMADALTKIAYDQDKGPETSAARLALFVNKFWEDCKKTIEEVVASS